MQSHVWIIDTSIAKLFGNIGGAPSGLIVSPSHLIDLPISALVKGSLWLVARGTKLDSIVAKLDVDQIDMFEDGLNAGDYLLSIDQLRSFKLSNASNFDSTFVTDATASLKVGISPLQSEIEQRLKNVVHSGLSTNFRKFGTLELKFVELPSVLLETRTFATEAIRKTIASISVDKIWASGTPVQLPPFANLISQKIADALGGASVESFLEILTELDPLTEFYFPNKEWAQNDKPTIGFPTLDGQNVDTRLIEIDPAKLRARRFIARKLPTRSIQDALNLTEVAEAAHQDMLRDIASYLSSLGMTSWESRSIDLALTNNAQINIFEIKTANAENVHMQIAKGVYQLMRYKAALENEGRLCRMTLIITDLPYPSFKAETARMLDTIGIKILFYRRNLDWPERLQGLFD